jgi:hypothetical protein
VINPKDLGVLRDDDAMLLVDGSGARKASQDPHNKLKREITCTAEERSVILVYNTTGW